jgi:nucleotide-binding universal stress UspA family protein
VGIAPADYAADRRAAVALVGAAYDGSPESERALHLAERISAGLRGRLQVIAVTESNGSADPVLSELTEAVLTAPVSVHAKGDLRRGEPARELSRASSELDLLVCGSRGYGRVRGLVLGSVSSALMGSARCPILVVQRA